MADASEAVRARSGLTSWRQLRRDGLYMSYELARFGIGRSSPAHRYRRSAEAEGSIAAMKSRTSTGGGLVYSTDAGRMCPACRRPIAQCICKQAKAVTTSDGIVRVSRNQGPGRQGGDGGQGLAAGRGRACQAGPAAQGSLRLGRNSERRRDRSAGRPLRAVIGWSRSRATPSSARADRHPWTRNRWKCWSPARCPTASTRGASGRPAGQLPELVRARRLSFGRTGRLLALMHEIDHNGLKSLLDPLRRC